MATFINKIISGIQEQYHGDYRNLCIVFPTRRACLIFRSQLADLHNKPVWAPGIMSIGDFVARHVKVQVADEIPLLVALFDVYKKYWPEQDFGKYYAWGKMLLNDFDEIDKQLTDSSNIFKNISELKKIDAAFLPEPESLKWIGEFVSSFDEKQLSKLQKQFADSWNRLKEIYDEYQIVLNKQGIAYEGKAYRELLQSLKDKKFTSPYHHFIFAGFYGFSRAEEATIQLLSQQKKVELFWDADEYYINNKKHEAGYYFRKSKLTSGEFSWKENTLTDQHKEITIVSVPLQAAQAKFTGDYLLTMLRENKINMNTTAIVLPDENMLLPVLYALPAEIDKVNVTMGFPLQHTHFSELFKVINDLHSNYFQSEGKIAFLQKNTDRLLHHPLMKGILKSGSRKEDQRKFKVVSVDYFDAIISKEHTDIIFQRIENSSQLFHYLNHFISLVISSLHAKNETAQTFEISVLNFIKTELEELNSQLTGYLNEINLKTAWQMIIECVAGLKIPFSGEPVHGLQVMGFLETRALDFETILMLNVNEGILPRSGHTHSFIPYSLRKGFGLSTYEDQEASFAYHFYRLLHRSKKVILVHNSEVSKTGGGEPGRYILQIKHELKKIMGDRLSIHELTIGTPVHPEPINPISITKSEEVLQKLNRYIQDSGEKYPGAFSSTSLTTYINCKLQFYFSYIAGIKEKDEPGTHIEAADFGNILHGAMEKLYGECKELVTGETITGLLKKSDHVVEATVDAEFHTSFDQLSGVDILTAEVIKELVRRILKRDIADTPFMIKQLEGTYKTSIITRSGNVQLLGKFDRVDEVKGNIRIIDYKTGKVVLKNKSTMELFTEPAKKTLFQLYFYSLLYRKNHPDHNFTAGFYIGKSIGNGVTLPEVTINETLLAEFEELLAALIDEIYNPAIPFNQTDDVKRCEYCEYKNICNR